MSIFQKNSLPAYGIEQGNYGQELVLTGEWSDSLLPLFERDFSGLWVNYARGFIGDDLEFLRKIPSLKSLTLIVYHISDLSPINSLHQLRGLNVGDRKFHGLDFTNFPNLEYCGIDWQTNIASLLSCSSLRRIFLQHYPKSDLLAFHLLKNLEVLMLANSPQKSLEGIAELPSLRKLGLYNMRVLSDLSALKDSPELSALDIEGCRKLGSIEAVASLKHLISLRLSSCGDIDSIKPVSELKKLVDLIFRDTNVLDGNMTPLFGLPKLEFTMFTNRKHYTHKNTDFPQSEMARISMQ